MLAEDGCDENPQGRERLSPYLLIPPPNEWGSALSYIIPYSFAPLSTLPPPVSLVTWN